jgi:hypothetical protein
MEGFDPGIKKAGRMEGKAMAPLQDPLILAQYRSALANWHVTGYVEWKDIARDWALLNDDPEDPIIRVVSIHDV